MSEQPTIVYRPWRILIVCTANVCRSPVAQRVLKRHLDKLDVPAKVVSAGVRGGQLEVAPETYEAASIGGIDISDHVSRAYTEDLGTGADLIITMERVHLQEIVGHNADLWRKSYTLKGIVRRARTASAEGKNLDQWLDVLGDGRKTTEMVGTSPLDDVTDPYGMPTPAHISMTVMVSELTGMLADHIAKLELPRKT